MDALAPAALRPADGFFEPVVSADSQWVAFNDEGDYTLRKMSLAGGPTVAIAKVGREMLGATWGANDTIVYATSEGLWRVSARRRHAGVHGEARYRQRSSGSGWPECLPGGQVVLYAISGHARPGSRTEDVEIAALDLRTGASKVIVRGATNPRYSATGHLLYVSDGTLRAVKFDPDTLETCGDSVPIADGLMSKSSGGENVAVAADGTLVYVTGAASTSAVSSGSIAPASGSP